MASFLTGAGGFHFTNGSRLPLTLSSCFLESCARTLALPEVTHTVAPAQSMVKTRFAIFFAFFMFFLHRQEALIHFHLKTILRGLPGAPPAEVLREFQAPVLVLQTS